MSKNQVRTLAFALLTAWFIGLGWPPNPLWKVVVCFTSAVISGAGAIRFGLLFWRED